MSTWMHVAGSIRLDSLMQLFLPPQSLAQQVVNILNTNLPAGSEGPLNFQMAFRDDNAMNVCNIGVYGDLRDVDDFADVERWLNALPEVFAEKNFAIRQLVLQAEIEDRESRIWKCETVHSEPEEGKFETKQSIQSIVEV